MLYKGGCAVPVRRAQRRQHVELEEIEKVAGELYPKLKALGREWYRDSVVLCLWHKGKCAYCGFDLLSGRGVCYHYWCVDHLLPQCAYPELKDHIENKVLACRACNSVKGEWDPDPDASVYCRNGQLTSSQRERLLGYAKEYVGRENARLEGSFGEELALLRPFV
jgi:5-methylcytosine-specific restriction endonuclease McrA